MVLYNGFEFEVFVLIILYCTLNTTTISLLINILKTFKIQFKQSQFKNC